MQMNRKELEAFAKEAAKGLKTPEDLDEFSPMLKKITVEAALNAQRDEHLGYEKHRKSSSTNSRNGKSSKRVKTEEGEFELETPRDRDGSFDPKLVKKPPSRFTSMDDKILWLYAQGMSTRDIVNAFDEWYGAERSPTLVSRVTNAVIEPVIEWPSRPLDAFIPSFTSTVSWSKSVRINGSSINPSFWHWVSTPRVTKNGWGWPKTKAQSFG